jgi:NAD(P)-dependent dehydrogenase (short-subunit alcohol dehydrogenase family)
MGWALVTGGAKGLGAEICRQLARQGHPVVVHYHRSKEEAIQVVGACRREGVEAEAIGGDFTTRESTLEFVARYVDQFPTTQHLINNVGNYLIQPLTDTTVLDLDALFQTNLFTPLEIIQAVLPSIRKQQGQIINIGVAGLNTFRADTHSPAYSMTKMGLWMATKSLAAELAKDHVRVNMISPGYLDNTVDLPPDLDSLPMGRLGHLSEVARVVTFLLDPESSYITGQNIEVAGGVRL